MQRLRGQTDAARRTTTSSLAHQGTREKGALCMGKSFERNELRTFERSSSSAAAEMAKPELTSISRLDLSGALGGERYVGMETARQRSATAPPQLGGDAMAGLLGGAPAAPPAPLTARVLLPAETPAE
jgi:hypothetical protein